MITQQKATYMIEIESKPESINVIESLIDSLKEQYKISEDSYGNMLVAVTEAVNNAIYHGNKTDPSKKVKISYNYLNDRLVFTVTDEGKGFDYFNLPDPTAPENLEKPCGRGVFLMKNLADQLIFSENGRVVEMYFSLKNN